MCVEGNFIHIMAVAEMSHFKKKIKISIKSLDRSSVVCFLVLVSGVYRITGKPDADQTGHYRRFKNAQEKPKRHQPSGNTFGQ